MASLRRWPQLKNWLQELPLARQLVLTHGEVSQSCGSTLRLTERCAQGVGQKADFLDVGEFHVDVGEVAGLVASFDVNVFEGKNFEQFAQHPACPDIDAGICLQTVANVLHQAPAPCSGEEFGGICEAFDLILEQDHQKRRMGFGCVLIVWQMKHSTF
jgi:hypothetical protein